MGGGGGVLYLQFLDRSKSHFYKCCSNETLYIVRLGYFHSHILIFKVMLFVLFRGETWATASVFAVFCCFQRKGIFMKKDGWMKINETLQNASLCCNSKSCKVLRRFRNFLTEIWRHKFLTSRRNFDDVITLSFASETSRNFVKCLLLTKRNSW